MKFAWMKVGIIIAAFGVGLVSYVVTRTPDGIAEQAAEAVLRAHGIDVDISPEHK